MEPVEDILKKIPLALHNLKVDRHLAPLLQNYFVNFFLTALKDPALQKSLHENPTEYIKYLSKL